MNYLNAINRVLRRLREDEVSSVTSTTYAKLVGDYVNDAVRLVEDSWDWSVLRKEIAVDTVADQREYNLSGVSQMFKTLSVANETQKCFVDAGTEAGLQEDKFVNTANASVPTNYVYTGYVENVNGVGVAFYPVPDKVYNLKFNVVDRSDELTEATDNIVVPYLPVIQFATAMAAEERGETGGASAQSLYALAKSSLADAISMDAARFPTETIWYDV